MSDVINTIDEDEVTLKDLLFKIRDFFNEVLRHWLLVILITIPFVIFFIYKAISTPPTYTAKLTFMVNEDEGGGIGGAMAILSQFGFAGGRGGGKYNMKKILDLSQSRKIIEQTLFDSLTLDGNTDLAANHLIHLYDYHEKWKENETGLKDLTFSHNDISRFSRPENFAFLQLYRKIIGGENTIGLYGKSLNEETGIMTLNAESLSEPMTIHLLNSIYQHLGDFYIKKSVEKQENTLKVVQLKVDSIKKELARIEYTLANFRDSNRGTFTQKAKLKEQQLTRNAQILGLLYGESLKNLEIADFSLKNKTPFIQVIDEPIAPIPPNVQSPILAIIIGSFIGGFIAVAFIVIRKIIRDALKG